MEEQELQRIIEAVTEEVMRRAAAEPGTPGGLLAVFGGHVYDAGGVADYLKASGMGVTCALCGEGEFASAGMETRAVRTPESRRRLVSELQGYARVALVTPPLWQLQHMAAWDDGEFAVAAVLRPLLWGRDVRVLLDFGAPGNANGNALAKAVGALEAMGVGIETLAGAGIGADRAGRDLVTERDVKEAFGNGSLRVKAAPGAIVTQLAQDTAGELGVTIER